MVEILILVAIIIAIRAVYLWLVRGAEDAKAFIEQSTNEVNKGVGCMVIVSLILLALLVLLIIALSS